MSNEPGQALREHPGACSTDPATRIGDHIGTELAEFDRYMDEVLGLASGTRRQRVRILARFLVSRLSPTRSTLGRSAGSTCGSCNGRSPTLNGRRQPSRGGTSRMIARFTDRTGHRGPLTLPSSPGPRRSYARHADHLGQTSDRLPSITPGSSPTQKCRGVDLNGRIHRRLTPHIYTDVRSRTARCGTPPAAARDAAARNIRDAIRIESAEPRPTAPQLTKDDWQPFEAGGDRRKSNNGRWCFYFAKMGQCRSLSAICVTGSGQLIAKRGSS